MKIYINQILANNQTENQLPVLIRACNSLVMKKVKLLLLDISSGRERVDIVIIFSLFKDSQLSSMYSISILIIYMACCYFLKTCIFALEIVLKGKYKYTNVT